VTITGTGFESGAIVTLGGTEINVNFYGFGSSPCCGNSTTLYATTRARVAGTVDLVVTNPDRQAGTLTAGYTYASPESFDFNGNWEGGAMSGHETFRFTIQNDTLVSVLCATSGTLTFSPPPPVSNGAFSFSGDDGVAVSGKIVSASEALGKVNIAPCLAGDWYASRR
jgi:hypothetical protein